MKNNDTHMEIYPALANQLLARLSAAIYQRLEPKLTSVLLPIGWSVPETGYVFFPTAGIISLLYVMENGASAEIAVIGKEGLVGLAVFMGGEIRVCRKTVVIAGQAYRLDVKTFTEEFERDLEFQHLMLRYTQSFIAQISQTAVCNRHHTVEQQLCRWLLLSIDRLRSNELSITQEVIAGMLGVRREGITAAAGRLQASGAIHYRRGHIKVLDRQKLEECACECYTVVKKESERLAKQDYR